MVVDAMGEKAALLHPIFIKIHIGHVHIHEVLHGTILTIMDSKKKIALNPLTLSIPASNSHHEGTKN